MIRLFNANNNRTMFVMVHNIQHVQAGSNGLAVLYMESGAPLAATVTPEEVANMVNTYLHALAGMPL